jgi:diaminopimelate decarboxylase
VAGFFRENDQLTCDGVLLSEIARRAGTPVYVYSGAALEENFRRSDDAFAPVSHLVCYAAKANSSLAIPQTLGASGRGRGRRSGGELRACPRVGLPAGRIVFSGVGKTGEETRRRRRGPARLQRRVRAGDREDRRGGRAAGKIARVALRVNPTSTRSHLYISTGLNTTSSA